MSLSITEETIIDPHETLIGILELIDQEVVEPDNVGAWAVEILTETPLNKRQGEALELANDGGLDELRALLKILKAQA